MNVEWAVETRRLALLRLLAGWFFLAGLVSREAFVLPLPRELCRYLDSLVVRAELAAQYLLYIAVRQQGGNPRAIFGALPAPSSVRDAESVPTVAALSRRMAALRDLLENLSREARRLMCRHADRRVWHCDPAKRPLPQSGMGMAVPSLSRQVRAPRAERPPDCAGERSTNLPPSRFRAGGAGGWIDRKPR